MREHNFNIPRQMLTSVGSLGTSIQNLSNSKKIQNYVFNMNEVLGKGNFSHVYKAVNITNSKIIFYLDDIVAIKVIELSMMKAPSLHNLLSSEI
jgi:serine/threonine protein kinase